MKKKGFLSLLLLMLAAIMHAQIGTWNDYMSYTEVQQIVKGGDRLYVRADSSVYDYNLNDQSITTHSRAKDLNDVTVVKIGWNSVSKRLLIAYDNGNMDLLENNGNVINIGDLYNKENAIDKSILNIVMHEEKAYVCTGFGVMNIDTKRAVINESYILNEAITHLHIQNNTMYVKTQGNKVRCVSMKTNMIDISNWTDTDDYKEEWFGDDTADRDEYMPLVSTLKPGGPKSNYFFSLHFSRGKLYGVPGMYMVTYSGNRPGCVQVFDGNDWQIYEDPTESNPELKQLYYEIDCIAAAPSGTERVFAAGRSGVFEFIDGRFVKHHTVNNSTLTSPFPNDKIYVVTQGITFDGQGTLWCLNSLATDNIHTFSAAGQWNSRNITLPENTNINLRHPFFDSRGLLWFVNDNWLSSSLHCYQPETGGMKTINSFYNQDGTALNINTGVHCALEDNDHNIWIGTVAGPLMLPANEINSSFPMFTQVKIPRNDGTNYADYLLSNIEINAMAMDGAGRLWMGTANNGVYLIDSDKMTQLHHFTTANSPLLSNYIYDLAINPTNGVVYISTEKGLCSYHSDATTPNEEMSKDNVWAYPNPVEPHYTGMITITGLSYNADVKICAANGAIIHQGRSNGGTYQWNGCDSKGQRVASGVYMVQTAKSDGSKGTVCKIAVVN